MPTKPYLEHAFSWGIDDICISGKSLRNIVCCYRKGHIDLLWEIACNQHISSSVFVASLRNLQITKTHAIADETSYVVVMPLDCKAIFGLVWAQSLLVWFAWNLRVLRKGIEISDEFNIRPEPAYSIWNTFTWLPEKTIFDLVANLAPLF